MASSNRPPGLLRTLILAPLAGSLAATIAGAVVWAIVIAPQEPMEAGIAAWSMVFVFMMLALDLAVVAVLLTLMLGILRRIRPSLMARQLFPTAFCMVIGAAVGGALVQIVLELTNVAAYLARAGTKWSIFFVTAAVGGAIAGAIIARGFDAAPAPGGRAARALRGRS
jgi:hypothetical protein